ncbi:MAG: hypothetical protein N2689_09310 [Verrucomicrobiae bacterium]|nr:hypothetical protein [Verrucomicrobiae bacterium]
MIGDFAQKTFGKADATGLDSPSIASRTLSFTVEGAPTRIQRLLVREVHPVYDGCTETTRIQP